MDKIFKQAERYTNENALYISRMAAETGLASVNVINAEALRICEVIDGIDTDTKKTATQRNNERVAWLFQLYGLRFAVNVLCKELQHECNQ